MDFRSDYLGERAIVVGGGIAGLSAARAVSDRFREVVILDRDELPDSVTPRPGVPQGKHPHGLLAGGLKALEQLFPGFGNELRQAGAVPINRGYDILFELPGQDPWSRIKLDHPTYSMTRPLLEFLKVSRRKSPAEASIGVNMHYSSGLFAGIDIRDNYKIAYTLPNAPEGSRGGLIMPAENNTYQVVLIGRGDEIPPIKEGKFRNYARTLWTPTVYNAIKNAKLLTEIAPNSLQQSRWRNFAQVPDFPRGLLPIGDAICRFNPTYGQGMSVAARQASLLFDLLGRTDSDLLSTLAPEFLTKAEELIADPWAMSAVPDFVYPETTGVRPKNLEEHLNFQKGLGRLAARDTGVFELLTDVRNLLTPLTALVDRSIVSRVESELASELSPSSAAPAS